MRMDFIFKPSRTINRGLILAGLTALSLQAQVSWQTTHFAINGEGYSTGECNLVRGTVKAKVFPAYLDMEEDIEIGTVGVVQSGGDAKTLEISGNFTLPPGAVITGALAWDGDNILQGKLLDRNISDSLYEDLVDRNKLPPPRPRDPLIVTLTGKDTYQFKIYPVELGHTRRFRLRYQLPPKISTEGLEIALKAAVIPLFNDADLKISLTLENSSEVNKVIFVDGSQTTGDGSPSRIEMGLPRTRLLAPAALGPDQYVWSNELFQNILQTGIRILPIDPMHQVMVKTSFANGNMAGNYLNLYTGVTDEVLKSLHQRIEVVVFWKWHNPGTWVQKYSWGEENGPSVWEAQSQAANIMNLYDQMGGLGNKIGLLHDDSRNAVHAFAVGAKGEAAYQQATDYLHTVQGDYVSTFAHNIKAIVNPKPGSLVANAKISKDKFYSNLRLVKTLYSPETGVTRHLLMITAGADYVLDNNDMNAVIDSMFQDKPISISGVNGNSYNQAGFDFWNAQRAHNYQGAKTWTGWTDMPSFAPLNLNVTVRNAKNAYDFGVNCQGGLSLSCGTLTFHGKSDVTWQDSLEWQAFDQKGKPLGAGKTGPKIIEHANDTAIAILWAGSTSPFSEKKELPLGPIYGFVDRWASLLALEKDSLNPANVKTYSDSGVPRISNANLLTILPNYKEGQVIDLPTSIEAITNTLSNPSAWKLEKSREGMIVLRIPGLASDLKVEVEVYDLTGKRFGNWNIQAETGLLRFNASTIQAGIYVLKIRVAGLQGIKRIAL